MAPPSYADLGKQARDLFSKNYRKNGLVLKIKPSSRREPRSPCPCGHQCASDRMATSSATNSSGSPRADGHGDKSSNSVGSSMSIYPKDWSKEQRLISCMMLSLCEDFGLVKLDVKTKTPSGVDFTVNGNSNNDTGRVTAALETKYLIKDYGLTMKEKWNTDNILSSEVTIEDQILKGLKIGGNCSFAPQSGKKTGGIKTAFKTDSLHLNSDIDLDYAGALIHASGVLGYQGWLAGAQLSFDPSKNRLTRTNFAIGFNTPEFILHTNVNDGQEFAGSVYQKVNEKLESGVHLAWTSSSNTTRFGLGCVYKLDSSSSLRAKVNNTSQIGLGFTHRLRPGITLTLNAMIDGKNFNQGGHKLGMGFELEA